MHFLFFSRAKTTKLSRKICLNCTSCPISYKSPILRTSFRKLFLLLSIFNLNNESAELKSTDAFLHPSPHKHIGHQNDKKKVNKLPKKKLKLLLRSSLKLDHPQIIQANFNFVTSTIRKCTKMYEQPSHFYIILISTEN